MNYVIGLDMGAAFIKGALLADDDKTICYMERSGKNYRDTALRVKAALHEQSGLPEQECQRLVVTGCGNECIDFADEKVNDFICLARYAAARGIGDAIVVDMGAQSCRSGELDENGRLSSITFSEKCASGSGRVLESAARVLHVPFLELATLGDGADAPAEFTTSCAVFAESEIITAIARGHSPKNIAAGVHNAVAKKIVAMTAKSSKGACFISGGGALDDGLIKTLRGMTEFSIYVMENPQFVNAIGAAFIARGDA